MRSTRALALAALFLAATVPAVARAQAPAPGSSKVAAEALFEEGRKLVAAANYAEACPKFADSQRLDPSPGTLLNLASCWEKLGRSATAWATYREAASAANAVGRADYVATAQRHADALQPRLAHLTTNVAQPLDGMVVKRDDVTVDRAEWGVAIPVDRGTHTVQASAPGHKSWASSIDVAQDGAQVTVAVPALEALPVEATPPPPPPTVFPPPVPPPVVPPPPSGADSSSSSGSTQRVLGVVLAGVGVVGLGLGTFFVIEAKGKYDDSLKNCHPDDPSLCNSDGVTQRNDARSAGNIASVAFGVGAAALVGGGILWLTAPSGGATKSGGSARIGLAPTLGGAVLQGAW
jgi:hypothetical protein